MVTQREFQQFSPRQVDLDRQKQEQELQAVETQWQAEQAGLNRELTRKMLSESREAILEKERADASTGGTPRTDRRQRRSGKRRGILISGVLAVCFAMFYARVPQRVLGLFHRGDSAVPISSTGWSSANPTRSVTAGVLTIPVNGNETFTLMSPGLTGPAPSSLVEWHGQVVHLILGGVDRGKLLTVSARFIKNSDPLDRKARVFRIELWSSAISETDHEWWSHAQQVAKSDRGNSYDFVSNPTLQWTIEPGTYSLLLLGYGPEKGFKNYQIGYTIHIK